MKIVLAIALGLVAVVALGILYAFYKLRKCANSLNLRELADSGSKAPTMPMIDPDAFGSSREDR